MRVAEPRHPSLSPLDKEIICHANALMCESKCGFRQSIEYRSVCKSQCATAEKLCVKRAQGFEAPSIGNGQTTISPDLGTRAP